MPPVPFSLPVCVFFPFSILQRMVGWLTLIRVVRLIMGGEKMSVNQSNNGLTTEKYKSTLLLEFDQKCFTQVLMQGKHTHNLICIEVSTIKCIK